jgi:hypothetical protein
MFTRTIKTATALLVLVVLLGAGGREQAPRRRPNVMGRIVAIAKDGKALTLEVAPAGRGEPAKTVEIKLTAKTKLLFSGVGLGGAKLTEDYWVGVWTADGTKDTAERIDVRGNRGERNPPSVAGAVTGVINDGKTITIRIAPRGRDAGDTSRDIRLTEKTHVLYANVGKGAAKPTDGYRAEVWLKDGAKDIAARVNFTGSAMAFERREPMPNPDRSGQVVGISKDGTVLTLAMAARERGAEPIKENIKLSDKTFTAYFQVGPGGAQPTDGYVARAWLADGSKDTAGKVVFQGVPKDPPTVRGKLTGIAKDAKSITLETISRERGAEPMTLTIKFTPKTKITFQNVGPDGALLAEGYIAQVLLEDADSTNTAAHVLLSPAPPAVAERNRRD